jgi:hypothetical protein
LALLGLARVRRLSRLLRLLCGPFQVLGRLLLVLLGHRLVALLIGLLGLLLILLGLLSRLGRLLSALCRLRSLLRGLLLSQTLQILRELACLLLQGLLLGRLLGTLGLGILGLRLFHLTVQRLLLARKVARLLHRVGHGLRAGAARRLCELLRKLA